LVTDVVVIYGDPFGGQTPRLSKERAVEAVNKALFQADDVDELADGDEKPIRCSYGNWSAGYLFDETQGDIVRYTFQTSPEVMPVDPMERMVDGITVQECVDRFSLMQQEGHMGNLRYVFTPGQLTAARLAWSSALRAKQAEVKERDRLSVRCDEQWGEDV
jgi:hypothetical protein